MSDLGSIGKLFETVQKACRFATWLPASMYSNQIYLSEAGEGIISGIVKENGTPKSYVCVYLFYRGHEGNTGNTSGETQVSVIDRVKSGVDGSFSFTGLNKSKDCYFVIVLDPAGGIQYNIARADKITPV